MSGDFGRDSIISADPEVVSCELEGGAALLDLRSSTYFSLNPIGADIWGMLADPASVDAIHGQLTERYEVDPHRCYADLVALLRQMAEAGLIKVDDARSN